MTNKMNADEVLIVQRKLRRQMLDEKRSIRWPKARDLAAHLLIRLDDVKACWQFGTEWLLTEMAADRITAGPCDSRLDYYSPRFESLHPDKPVPSLKDTRFEIAEASMRRILAARQAVAFIGLPLLSKVGEVHDDAPPIAVKLGMAMRDEGHATGMICAHWLDPRQPVSADRCVGLTDVVNEVFNPILLAAERLARQETDGARGAQGKATSETAAAGTATSALASLTPAELRLARLAATGMSYKEIARQLNRSFSTVDHHLRSIREKFNVHSSARLITLLAAEFNRLEESGEPVR